MADPVNHPSHYTDGAIDMVNHPPHYTRGWIEHCEVVEDQGWADGYYPAQVLKYIYRAGHKPDNDKVVDLRKGLWYLTRWIAWEEKGRGIWGVERKTSLDSDSTS